MIETISMQTISVHFIHRLIESSFIAFPFTPFLRFSLLFCRIELNDGWKAMKMAKRREKEKNYSLVTYFDFNDTNQELNASTCNEIGERAMSASVTHRQ